MKVLVINAGSSSCKYQLLEMDTETVLASGLAERIGQGGTGKLTHKIAPDTDHEEKIVRESAFPTHVEAMELVISLLTDAEKGVIKDKSEIYAIGHRVLHGGESITETVKVDENVKQIIRDCFPLGPLHNPANITGIKACEEVMPGVPMVAVFSEGGSGGAEAISLADRRLMLSHGYYSVISPEGAAAIEGRLKPGQRATPELIERCATQLHITAEDNLQFGYIDRVIQEPSLGARPYHYDFFRTLRQEIIRATDETVLSVRSGMFRGALLRRMSRDDINLDEMYIRWHLSQGARERLVLRRQKKFLRLSRGAYIDRRPFLNKMRNSMRESWGNISARIKYALITKHQRKFAYLMDEMTSEMHLLKRRLTAPFCRIPRDQRPSIEPETVRNLTTLSDWDEESESRKGKWTYISPRAKEDRAITCPNAGTHGCLDLWSPDLYGEFAGVCTWCGHHFPMEYQWFVKNVFDEDSVREFNGEVEASNPLQFEGFDARLAEARERTKLKSGCITFEAKLDGTKMIVALFAGTFRGGSVGSAEGTKFVEAAELAMKKRYPLLAYVHGTAGIRIQEGTHGVIQMPRCTVAVRRYINAGGLYTVLYDTNSYAGPVASFLGCSPYQYAMRSSNLGFAGRGVIKETTGIDIEPHYHSAYKALARGHIQGVWDRREARANLKQVLLTMGGRNLYYR